MDTAVATSGGYGTVFEPSGRFHHLFVPATGNCAHSWASVSVTAATATIADALSTAIAVAPRDHAGALLRAGGGIAALLIDQDGNTHRV